MGLLSSAGRVKTLAFRRRLERSLPFAQGRWLPPWHGLGKSAGAAAPGSLAPTGRRGEEPRERVGLVDRGRVERSQSPSEWVWDLGRFRPPWGQTEFLVNLKLGLTSHACIQSPGHSQDGPSNHAPTRSVCTAAAVASLRARFSHSCGINVSLASLGRCARTCERYHGLFSPGSRPTGSSQTLSASPTGLRASWACGLMVLGGHEVLERHL